MSTTTTLARLAGARELLEIVDRYDPDTPYQTWRPQIRVPATLAPLGGLPVTFVVVNQKGGAGKTTTALELAAAWVARGFKVRLIDADPQDASLTAWLRSPDDLTGAQPYTLADVFQEKATLDQATWPTRFEGLTLVPSFQDLAMVEYDPRLAGVETTLRYAIAESAKEVDITIIDCAPALGKLSLSGLVAAHHALIPAKVGTLDAKAMASLSDTIRKVQRRANPELQVRAAVLTAWDRSTLARELADQIGRDYPEAIVAPVRRSIRVAEAPATGEPIRLYDSTSTAASDYDQLADMIIPEGVA